VCLQKGACQVLSRFADVPSLTTRASWVCGRSSLTPGAHRCACAVQVLAAQASGWSRHRRRANGRRPFGAQPAGVARRSMPKKKSAHVEEAAAPDAAAPAHAAAEAHKPKKKQHAAAEAAEAAPARLPAGEVELLDSDLTNAAAEKQPVPKAYLYAPSAVPMRALDCAHVVCAPAVRGARR